MQSMPHPNCYWVIPGKFMAGEYPGSASSAAAREKVAGLLSVGITTFVDLTEGHELEHYDRILQEQAAKLGIESAYHRISIPDVDVPESPAVMNRILDTIDAALASGEVVYVHCWGGIGRTGTVVGCYLVRHGLSGDKALARVHDLYHATMEKRHRRPQTPETGPQTEWVRNWHRHM